MKKIISLFLLAALLLSMFSMRAVATGETIEKIYCTATLEDDFYDNEILIVLMPEYNTATYTAADFSEIACIDLKELTASVVPGEPTRIFLLTIPGHSKQNVLDAIKELEKRPDIYSAEPNRIIHVDDYPPSKDALQLQEDLKKLCKTCPTDAVIQLFQVSLPDAFSTRAGIERILESDNVVGHYVATKISDGTWIYPEKGEDGIIYVERSENTAAMNACLSGDVVKNIGSDVKIRNRYYLSAEAFRMGSAIYYETDKGDYVHYFGGQHCIGEFLFPAEIFRELQTAIHEAIAQDPDAAGDAKSRWDLTAFELNAETFDLNAESPFKEKQEDTGNGKQLLWIGISVGVCLVAAGAVFAVIRKRKS